VTTKRYMRAAHAVMAAIGFNPDKALLEPKHMRTGIDMSKADMKGLVDLLIAKGVFTGEELTAALDVSAEEEAQFQKQACAAAMGVDPDKLTII